MKEQVTLFSEHMPGSTVPSIRCALQEVARQVNEDHQGRFHKLQAGVLPPLVSLALRSGGMWLAQIHVRHLAAAGKRFERDGAGLKVRWCHSQIRLDGLARCCLRPRRMYNRFGSRSQVLSVIQHYVAALWPPSFQRRVARSISEHRRLFRRDHPIAVFDASRADC
jgi:hypothetical protein